jgi:hypothetical protein
MGGVETMDSRGFMADGQMGRGTGPAKRADADLFMAQV